MSTCVIGSKRALRLCDFPSGHLRLCPTPVYIAADCSTGHGYKESNSSSMKLLSLLCIFCIIALVLVPGTSAFFFVSDKILVVSLVTAPLKRFFRMLVFSGNLKLYEDNESFLYLSELLKER